MGKKRRRTKKISKGLIPTVSSILLKAVRRDREGWTNIDNKVEAWRNGKNPWMTIANPDPNATNKRFIRVKADRYFGGTFKDLKSRAVKREIVTPAN